MFIKGVTLLFFIGMLIIESPAQTVASSDEQNGADIFSLIQDNSFGGTIKLYQDASLYVLLEKNARINEKQGIYGFRIQIYSGSGITAREKANAVKREFLELFPEFSYDIIYTIYKAPYFMVSVGDFRNRNEAFELYHSINKKFPGSYIIRSKINFPKLEVSAGE